VNVPKEGVKYDLFGCIDTEMESFRLGCGAEMVDYHSNESLTSDHFYGQNLRVTHYLPYLLAP
jgi:hypothetical protein